MKHTDPIRRIHLRTSGGIGIPLEGTVDVDALSPTLARRVQKALNPKQLARIARRPKAPLMTDQIAYEVILSDAQHQTTSYTVLESQADEELLELLDELMAQIIEAKRQARKSVKKQEDDEPPGPDIPPTPSDNALPAPDLEDDTGHAQDP